MCYQQLNSWFWGFNTSSCGFLTWNDGHGDSLRCCSCLRPGSPYWTHLWSWSSPLAHHLLSPGRDPSVRTFEGLRAVGRNNTNNLTAFFALAAARQQAVAGLTVGCVTRGAQVSCMQVRSFLSEYHLFTASTSIQGVANALAGYRLKFVCS